MFFILLTAALWIFLVAIARRASGVRMAVSAGAGVAAWLALVAMLASRGFYDDFTPVPPRVALAVLPAFIAAIAVAASPAVRRAIARVPAWWLIAVHVFRLPLEIVLHRLYADGMIPRQMTYEGLNFDIITGITAPIAAFIVARGGAGARSVGLLWNAMGLVLVAAITVISIVATPAVGGFPGQPMNTFVAGFPYIWLPGFIVPLAWMCHLLTFARLRR